jgi:hypothetical protein
VKGAKMVIARVKIDLFEQSHQVDIFEFARKANIEIFKERIYEDRISKDETLSMGRPINDCCLELTERQKKRVAIYEKELEKYPEARANDPSYIRLAGAVILQALDDVKKGDPDVKREAMHWLQSKVAGLFFETLGIDQNGLERWARHGMPTTLNKASKVYQSEEIA